MNDMSSNFSLKITVLVAAVLISGVLVPYTVSASPIFETDTAETGNSFFETEQSITNPLYLTTVTGNPAANLEQATISNLDVVVYDDTEVFMVFQDSHAAINNVFLSYTNSSIVNGTSTNGFFVDTLNSTQTVMLNENSFYVPNPAQFNIPLSFTVCNGASSPKIAVTDSHVFVAWIDQRVTSDCGGNAVEKDQIATIAIPKSNFDDLTTAFFNPHTAASGTSPAYHVTTDTVPSSFSIAASGSTAYIAWENPTDTSINLIPFDGAAYVASTGGFGTNKNFGVSASTPLNPDVVSDGTDVYVVWQNATAGDKNIKLATSSDSGVTFGAPANISGTNSVASTAPKLTEDGGIVHVSWRETVSTDQRIYAASSGNAYSPVDVSANSGTATGQQIIADGTNVFAVWQEANIGLKKINEVLFSRSTDSGVSFGTPIDLSDSSGNSQIPQISGNSTHVNVVWRDNTFLPSNTYGTAPKVDGQVWLKSSSDSGVSFGGLQVISESTDRTTNTFYSDRNSNEIVTNPAPIPKISSFAGVVVAVWNPDPSRTGDFANELKWEGSMKAALTSKVDISFNSTEYLSPRNATITVVDLSQTGLGPISANVLGDSMATKSSVSLTETAVSGTFSGEVELYDSTFKGERGDIFTANYTTASGADITTQAKIQETRTLDFLTAGGATGAYTHDIGDIVGLQLNDTDSNTLPGTTETVDVTITSDADSVGTSITLTETGDDTGIFDVKNGLVFMNGIFTPVVDDEITITISNDTGTGAVDVMRQKVSTSRTSAIDLFLTETGATTDVYTGTINICNSVDAGCDSPSIHGVDGDFITISDVAGTQVSNGFIIPDNATNRAAILVSCGDVSCGTVTATYGSLDVSISVLDTLASGGGGGGVSRAGLVVNALAGLSSFSATPGGGGADGSPPTTSLGNLITNKNFDVPDEIVNIVETSGPKTPLKPIPTSKFANFDLPLTINENGYPLGDYSNTIETFSAEIGEPFTITTLYYEQTTLQHVSMYMNLRDNTKGDLSKSDTQILYNKGKPLEIIDSNGFIEKVSVNIIEDDETIKKFAEFEIVFAKPMETSDIVLRSWDDRLRSGDIIIFDAILVVDPQNIDTIENAKSKSVESQADIDVDTPKVPEWIKNNAEWWSQGAIDDETFTNGIQFLIHEKMIDVPIGLNISVDKDELSPEELKELEEDKVIQIPKWIKNNAEWWSQGVITEDDFLKAIEYLVKNGIIEV